MRKRILVTLLFFVLAVSMLPTARASGENYRYFVYAANHNDNSVSAYSANADTGALTELPGSPYAAGQYPSSVTATADGKRIYVTNQGDGTVSGYSVNHQSGALTPLSGSPYSTSTYDDEDHSPEPVASVVSPDGGRLYVANRYNDNIKVFAIGAGGALSSEGYMIDFNGVSTPWANCSVDVHPSDRYLYAANQNSRSISAFNTDTLQRLPDSPFDTGTTPRSVAVHSDGKLLYAANWGEETITGCWINETNGSLSPVADSPFSTVGDDPTALLILRDTLYVANGYSHNIAVYAIDIATGALTEIVGSPFESGMWPTALAGDPEGAFLYLTNSLVGNMRNVRGYTIDASTGALTAVAGNPFDSGDCTMGIAVVRVTVGPAVCEIVGGMQYETLDAAIADVPASTPTTIRLLQTIERASTLAIDGSKRITFDLSGHDLSINAASGAAMEISQGSSLITTGLGALNAMGEEYGINATQGSTANITGNVGATAYAGVYAYGGDSSVTVIGNVSGHVGVLSGNTASVMVTGNVAGNSAAVLATESSNVQITGEATGTNTGVQANTNAEVTIVGNVRATSQDSTGLLLNSGAAVTVSGNVDAGLKGVSASEGSGARIEGSVTTVSDAGYGFAAYVQSGARVEIGGDAVAAAERGVEAKTSGLAFVAGDVQGKYYGIAVSMGAEVFVHGDVIAVLYGGAGINAFSVGKATIDGVICAGTPMIFGESGGALVTPTTKPGYLTYSDGQGSFVWVYDPEAIPFMTLITQKAPGSAIYFTSITAAEADLPGVWIDLNDNGVKDDGEELGNPKTVNSPVIRIYGKVTGLNCQLTGLTALDTSRNPCLVTLECSHNSLTSLDLSQNRKLEYLKCWSSVADKRLRSLDVSQNTELTYLDIWRNALQALDLSNNTKLERLFCIFSELTELDLSQNAELEFLNCLGGKLVSLTLNNPKLKSLYCDRNQLAALDVSGSPDLIVLSCRDNGAIASLNVSHLTKLDDFFCDDNALTSLTLPATSTLRRVTAENNRLTALDASGSTGLTYLRIHGNKLAGDAMTAFVNGLPDVAGGNLYIIDLTLSPPDGNVATKSQVAVAKGKGWNVFDFNDWDPVPYDGSEPEVPVEVRLLKPTAGVVWTGEQTIEWEATALDDEASELKITLEYALQSEGSTWQTIAANQTNTGKYKWDTSQVGRGGRYKVRVTAADPDGGTATATSEEFTIAVLTRAIVVAPNPARDAVTFYYDIPADGTLHVYDIVGRLVYSALLPASMHAYEWNPHAGGRPPANGIYLYIVVNDAQKSEVGRLVVSR